MKGYGLTKLLPASDNGTRPSHVAIPESDYIRRVHLIREALAKGGFKSAEVEKIMGGNWIRVLTEPNA